MILEDSSTVKYSEFDGLLSSSDHLSGCLSSLSQSTESAITTISWNYTTVKASRRLQKETRGAYTIARFLGDLTDARIIHVDLDVRPQTNPNRRQRADFNREATHWRSEAQT
jgi:hypothetical protein